jgi:hypothetical protein
MSDDRGPRRVSVVGVAVFVAELVLLAVLAVAGEGLGSGALWRVVLAVVLPVAAALAWALWLAPRASRRLGGRVGLAVKIALFTAAAVLLASIGFVVWAILFWVASVTVLVLADREHVAVDARGASPTIR